jgi:hypothetical protein
VAALRHATGAHPIATGKPDPTMHRESLLRSGAERPIVVGDRLDTDVEGANAVGCPSLLVLSGVTRVRDLLAAPPNQRPSYLGHDVAALLHAHPAPEMIEGGARCGAWSAAVVDDPCGAGLELRSDAAEGVGSGDPLDAVRALCAAWWAGPASGNAPVAVRLMDDADAAWLDQILQ